MVAEGEEDLLHLERGGERLDEHRRADRAVGEAQALLGEREHVVPQPRLVGGLDLRQVEVRPTPRRDQRVRVVEDVQPEVHEGPGCRQLAARAVDHGDVLLGQVPPARAHDDRGSALGGDAVLLALGAREAQLPADRVEQRELAPDDVAPRGGGGILLVGQPYPRAGVQRVDRHLRVGRARDLDAAVLEARAGAGHAPRRVLADVRGLGPEVRVVAVADLEAAAFARGEPVVTATAEAVVQLGEEGEGGGGEDLPVAALERTLDPQVRSGGGCRGLGAAAVGGGRGFDEGHDELFRSVSRLAPGSMSPKLSLRRRRSDHKWDMVCEKGGRGSREGVSGTARSRWSRRGRAWRCRG